jgi:hypothetical protein
MLPCSFEQAPQTLLLTSFCGSNPPFEAKISFFTKLVLLLLNKNKANNNNSTTTTTTG